PDGQEQAEALAAGGELEVQHPAHEAGRGDALAEPLLERRPPSLLRLLVGGGRAPPRERRMCFAWTIPNHRSTLHPETPSQVRHFGHPWRTESRRGALTRSAAALRGSAGVDWNCATHARNFMTGPSAEDRSGLGSYRMCSQTAVSRFVPVRTLRATARSTSRRTGAPPRTPGAKTMTAFSTRSPSMGVETKRMIVSRTPWAFTHMKPGPCASNSHVTSDDSFQRRVVPFTVTRSRSSSVSNRVTLIGSKNPASSWRKGACALSTVFSMSMENGARMRRERPAPHPSSTFRKGSAGIRYAGGRPSAS